MSPFIYLYWSVAFAFLNYRHEENPPPPLLFLARANLLFFLGESIMDCMK